MPTFADRSLHDLFEALPDAIIMTGADGRIVLANSQAQQLFRYPLEELLDSPIELLLPERYRVDHQAHRANFSARPRTRPMGANLQLHGRRRGGEEFPVEISLIPMQTSVGAMIIAAVRDITIPKRTEQKFEDLLESAPDAMVIVDPTGRIQLANSQAVQLFGWEQKDLLGQNIDLLVPERFRGRHFAHRQKFFDLPRARNMGTGLSLYGLRRDGSEFPVEISLSPLQTEDGLLVSSAIRDVTERKQVEASLHEANRLKSVFLANMSHELRTPLNAIIGFSELLVDGKAGALTGKQTAFLQDILGSGRHLLQLVNDLLDISKIEAGKVELNARPFLLRVLLDEVHAMVSPMATNKRLAVTVQMTAAVETVCLDRQKLKQILLNLVSNAVKFTPDGGQVQIAAACDDSAELQLEISDTGIGIASEDLPRLFVDFQRIESGSARDAQGTGLGLALTKRLVELQQGTISVKSVLGCGSSFTVRLPLSFP